MSSDPRERVDEVRRFYDRNTPSFVSLGQGGTVGAIHRAVWGPGVTTREEAFHYVEDQIATVIRDTVQGSRLTAQGDLTALGSRFSAHGDSTALPPPITSHLPPLTDHHPPTHVLDLGCGVGASLCYLAGLLPIRGTGITLSPLQAGVASMRIDRLGLADRVLCLEGDYTRLPGRIRDVDVAYAIESFVHGPDPAQFFSECSRVIRPGGVLIICDDFKRDRGTARRAAPTGVAAETLDRFAHGWHVNTLIDASTLQRLAAEAGFDHEATTDLTRSIEIGRLRDRFIDVGVTLFGWLPLNNTRLGHLIGGSALQKGLRHRWLGYDLAIFRRRAGGPP